jgi:hypothetical protein
MGFMMADVAGNADGNANRRQRPNAHSRGSKASIVRGRIRWMVRGYEAVPPALRALPHR